MDYQALYEALARLAQSEDKIDCELIAAGRNLHQLSEEELREEREQCYQHALRDLDRYTVTPRQNPIKTTYAAARMVVVAAEMSAEYLQHALDRIERAGMERDRIVKAAIALLEYEVRFPTRIDFQAEQRIVWQAF